MARSHGCRYGEAGVVTCARTCSLIAWAFCCAGLREEGRRCRQMVWHELDCSLADRSWQGERAMHVGVQGSTNAC